MILLAVAYLNATAMSYNSTAQPENNFYAGFQKPVHGIKDYMLLAIGTDIKGRKYTSIIPFSNFKERGKYYS
jgi:hypothetical protein